MFAAINQEGTQGQACRAAGPSLLPYKVLQMSGGLVVSSQLAACVVQQACCPGGELWAGGADSYLQGAPTKATVTTCCRGPSGEMRWCCMPYQPCGACASLSWTSYLLLGNLVGGMAVTPCPSPC